MPESRSNPLEVVRRGLTLLPLVLGPLQFARDARKEMGKRDRWSCQHCHQNFFREGVMVHAAHYPREHGPHNDQNIKHGRILCVRDHLLVDHIPMWEADPTQRNWQSLKLLTQLAWKDGYHTSTYYQVFPDQLEADRNALVQDLADHGLALGHFIDLDKEDPFAV